MGLKFSLPPVMVILQVKDEIADRPAAQGAFEKAAVNLPEFSTDKLGVADCFSIVEFGEGESHSEQAARAKLRELRRPLWTRARHADSETFAVAMHALANRVGRPKATQTKNLRGDVRRDDAGNVDSSDFNFTSGRPLAGDSDRGNPDVFLYYPMVVTIWIFRFGFARCKKFELFIARTNRQRARLG